MLESKLGEGAYGSVWKARHKESSSVFAIKIVKLSEEHDTDSIENEISILKVVPFFSYYVLLINI